MTPPIKNFRKARYPVGNVTQGFGENPSIYLPYNLSGHDGIDIVSFYGDEVHAVEGGIVVQAPPISDTGFGGQIKILTPSGNEWTYAHLSKQLVSLNQEVNDGDIIGLEGNTGFVVAQPVAEWGNRNPDHAGTHLHIGLRNFVPLVGEPSASNQYNCEYPNGTKGNILNYNNGEKGAIDCLPLLVESPEAPYVFAKDIHFGDTSRDVYELQKRLGVVSTGYYGPITRAAVRAFQQAHFPWWQRPFLTGNIVGTMTRFFLNN